MTYSVIAINKEDPDHYRLVTGFCKTIEATEPNHPAASNMKYTDWGNNPASVLFLLYNEQRLVPPTGQYFVLCNDMQTISASGVYIKDSTAILLVRTWTLKEFRTQYLLHEYLLPKQLEWAKANGATRAMITVNEYNRGLLTIFRRAMKIEHHPMSKWYKNATINDEPEIIQHTLQWTITFALD